MPIELTPEEFAPMTRLPVDTVVGLAAALDISAPAQIDRKALLEQCVIRLVELGRSEGLPFSKYDRDDLDALSDAHRSAIAGLQGLQPGASTSAILKVGQRVYKTYTSAADNPIPLMLPMLLTAVARAAADGVA